MKSFRLARFTGVAALALLSPGCVTMAPTQAPAPSPNIRSLVVVSVKRELQANERMILRAKGQYSDGKEIDINDGVLWQSSDERIASLSSQVQSRA